MSWYHKAKRCNRCIHRKRPAQETAPEFLGDLPETKPAKEKEIVRGTFYPERMRDILNSKPEFWSMEDHWLVNRFGLNVSKGMDILEAYLEAEEWASIQGKFKAGGLFFIGEETRVKIMAYHPKDKVLPFNRPIHYATRLEMVVEQWLEKQGLPDPDEEESPESGQDF